MSWIFALLRGNRLAQLRRAMVCCAHEALGDGSAVSSFPMRDVVMQNSWLLRETPIRNFDLQQTSITVQEVIQHIRVQGLPLLDRRVTGVQKHNAAISASATL